MPNVMPLRPRKPVECKFTGKQSGHNCDMLETVKYLRWPGVGGNGRTLSGGHRRVTKTVAGNGIDVPFNPAFPYGAGNCLYAKKSDNKKNA